MSAPRIGELFAGYGGLGMGVKAVLGGDVAWVSEIDKGAKKVLEYRFPDIPNHGDITTIDWSRVEPVDILTGGFPCQDVSSAGKRAGIRPGTRSGLWAQFAYGIDQLRPRLVVIENVRGLLSAEAHCDVEPCPWCVGDEPDGALRALGAVLGDLADLGYDASWYGLPASDVGAPHGRFRIFVTAHPSSDTGWLGYRDGGSVADADGRLHIASRARADQRSVPDGDGGSTTAALLPTPRSSDTDGAGEHGTGGVDLRTAIGALLPTPRVTQADYAVDGVHGKSLDVEARAERWGDYATAIARWEALARPAPPPTQLSSKGNPQLSAVFVEWMMGLPAGWVTAVPGITRNEALKLCGNGVVPQQAEVALRVLLARIAVAA